MYIAMLLYGSHARGDNRMKSDVDLLGIKLDGAINLQPPKRGVTLHEYPHDYLREKAKTGNLFLLHLVKESVALSDPLDVLGTLKEDFQFKASYADEKSEAAAVLWYCQNHTLESKKSRLRKRLTWVIRTLVIADAAENKKAVFSSRDIEKYSDMKGLKAVLDNRQKVKLSVIFYYADEVCIKFHKKIRPRRYKIDSVVVGWMLKKGDVAANTPSYLKGKKQSEILDEFYS